MALGDGVRAPGVPRIGGVQNFPNRTSPAVVSDRCPKAKRARTASTVRQLKVGV
jgi:hypothetical protein